MIDSRTPPSSAPSNRSKSHILTALPMLTIGLIFIVMAFVTLPTRTDGLSGGPVGVGVSRSLLTEMPPEPAEIPFPGPSTKRPSRAIDADYQLTLQAGTPRHSAVVSELLVESGSAAPPPPAHWTYNNPKTGPYNWQNLDPNYAVCAAGRRQSPIDLKVPVAQHPELNHQVGAVQVDPNLKHILFNYQMSNLTLVRHDNVTHTDEMINNGHTIQVNYETGSKIFVEGRPYDLMQFHFHSPSEHTLNSHHFDMELHLVHRNPEDGLLVVIGVWLEVPHGVVSMIRDLKGPYINVNELTEEEEEDGEESSKDLNNLLNHGKNTFLESLNWNRMPKTPSQEFLHNESEELNIFDILPFDQGYITYEGSLTTPPCSEIVTWYVFKNPITCSILQKNRFQSIFGQNARPTQLIHSRNITQTMDMDHTTLVPTGVSRGVYMSLVGCLIVVSLLLFFAMLFICTRPTHRLGRGVDHLRLYSMLSPRESMSSFLPSASRDSAEHHYSAINPLEDEFENGNRYRPQAQAQPSEYATNQTGATTSTTNTTGSNTGSQTSYGSIV